MNEMILNIILWSMVIENLKKAVISCVVDGNTEVDCGKKIRWIKITIEKGCMK